MFCDLVGFTSMFTQTVPSFALAHRLQIPFGVEGVVGRH